MLLQCCAVQTRVIVSSLPYIYKRSPVLPQCLLQGVIKLGEKASESKCTLVYGQMNEPPGARARVALTGTWHLCTHSTGTDEARLVSS